MQQRNDPLPENALGARRLFQRRPLCLAALGVLAGLLLFGAADVSRAPAVLAVLLVLSVAALWLSRRALLVLLPACLALLSALLQCPRAPVATSGVVTGHIAELPETVENRQVLLLDAAAVDGVAVRGRVRLTLYGAPALRYGQRVEVEAALEPSEAVWRTYDRYRGIACHAYAGADTLRVSGGREDLYGWLLAARESIACRIDTLFPDAVQAQAARGILLGGGLADMEEATVDNFRAVGIAHLLAVSGLHVGVLAGALLVPLRLIRRMWLRFAVLAMLLLAYAALTAFTPSVLRACVMLLTVLPAVPLRRRRDLPSALSLAFVLVLLAKPFALWNASFQLSFLAVAGLALLQPPLMRPLAVLGEQAGRALSSGLAVVVATIPATARFFDVVPLLSIVANLLVLPLVPLFFVPALLALVLSLFSLPLGAAVAVVPRAALSVILRVAEAGGALSLAVPAPGAAGYALFFLSMLFASPLCMARPRVRALLSAASLLLAVALWTLGAPD